MLETRCNIGTIFGGIKAYLVVVVNHIAISHEKYTVWVVGPVQITHCLLDLSRGLPSLSIFISYDMDKGSNEKKLREKHGVRAIVAKLTTASRTDYAGASLCIK